MIKTILDIVKILCETATKARKIKSEATNRSDKIEMLKIFFLLKDVQEDGERLLESALPSPIEHLQAASKEAAELRVKTWDSVLRRQGARLHQIKSFISTRSDLSVIDLKAQRRIKILIGSKEDRVLNLFELGSGLFFRTVLPADEPPETLAYLVTCSLQLSESNPFDASQIRKELNALDEALEDYRKTVSKLMSNEDIRSLSHQAREATRLL